MRDDQIFESKKTFLNKYKIRLEKMYGIPFEESSNIQKYNTLAILVREHLATNWIKTKKQIKESNAKQVYYFSMEFLIGRLLTNNLMNLGVRDLVESALTDIGVDINEIEEVESDAGLGNGGLGRLAACFLDSIATLNYPGHGNGIRYKYGFFKQRIINGYQIEVPDNWLQHGFAWDVKKSSEEVNIPFYGVVESKVVNNKRVYIHKNADYVKAIPYDMPVAGSNTSTVTTLTLWSAEPADKYPENINPADYEKKIRQISEFLYPDDSTDEGKILRLKQQYFFVAAGLNRIVKKHLAQYENLDNFSDKVCLHINDTHPSILIPELMRVLIDEYNYSWEDAWEITQNTCAYTNHTILLEALEKWEVRLYKKLLPRVFQITEEINKRHCANLISIYGKESEKVKKLAIIADDIIRMAHLAVVGTFSVNGVALLHTKLLKEVEMKEFNELYPRKFNNKTNGITHRKWLIHSNPQLVKIINDEIGKGWIVHPQELTKLAKKSKDKSFQNNINQMKQERKRILAKKIYKEKGVELNIKSIFDIQVKRLHEYKRQLMNALHIMYLYNRIKNDNDFKKSFHPQTFIFGGKAAPGYTLAKKLIKLINTIADKVNSDKEIDDLLKVVFVENYSVSYAELIMPAADISEQISTASKEASGTGNMKFMMNGAITVGTLDGANIEIKNLVGNENIIVFGLSASEVNKYQINGLYDSYKVYEDNAHIKEVVDQLINGFFTDVEEMEFKDIYDILIHKGDKYFVLKDFNEYIKAQEKANQLYRNREKWLEMSIINIAKSGWFSSDRTIEDYVSDIWELNKLKV